MVLAQQVMNRTYHKERMIVKAAIHVQMRKALKVLKQSNSKIK